MRIPLQALVSCFAAATFVLLLGRQTAVDACCPAPPAGQPVLNADQTVLIVWDAERKVQHWIRKASFRSDAQDFGFLIPTPTEPELAESGNDAFPILSRLTEPAIRHQPRGISIGCSAPPSDPVASPVRVLQEKVVAGFQAAVLAADSASDLAQWLDEHGYARTPQIEEWVRPYVESGWKLTALKIAPANDTAQPLVEASALRLTFQTDVPLFAYREPDPAEAVARLHPPERMLRIFFVGEGRFRGQLEGPVPWTGETAWSGPVSRESRERLTSALGLPAGAGPADWWLTEFEDRWPYAKAPSDLTFSPVPDQSVVHRPPHVVYYDSPTAAILPCALLLLLFGLPILLAVRLATKRSRVAAPA